MIDCAHTQVEDEEFRVKASLLKARTVFQKLVFYAADHPPLKPLLDELRKLQDHKVRSHTFEFRPIPRQFSAGFFRAHFGD